MDYKMIESKETKIVISTLPLDGSNYGGILQAYALQTRLKELGYDAVTDTLSAQAPIIKGLLRSVKRQVLQSVAKGNASFIANSEQRKIITRETSRFISENMNTIDLYNGKKRPASSLVSKFDAIVVGSDQVWRKSYSDVPAHLLDFAKGMRIKRVAYAASFGLDDLSEYSAKLIKRTASLARKFDAISVREDSGVDICRKYWNIKAQQHIDPTLLLAKDQYVTLINEDAVNLKKSSGNLFSYVLDRSDDKKRILSTVSSRLGLTVFEIMPEKLTSNESLHENPDKYVLLPVTQWLKSFADAEYIVTDSFHGCVFSIIFNKPFLAIGNNARGLTRFTSLLRIFGLENRLVSSTGQVTQELLEMEIDWGRVNAIIRKEQRRSRDYLESNLTKMPKTERIDA